MTEIDNAVELLKKEAENLQEARKKLVEAHRIIKDLEIAETSARQRYARALGQLEQLTGGYK